MHTTCAPMLLQLSEQRVPHWLPRHISTLPSYWLSPSTSLREPVLHTRLESLGTEVRWRGKTAWDRGFMRNGDPPVPRSPSPILQSAPPPSFPYHRPLRTWRYDCIASSNEICLGSPNIHTHAGTHVTHIHTHTC